MTEHQLLKADKDIDYRDAEKTLKLYLKERNMGVTDCREWARWTYGDMPFWSVWAIVSTAAFHITLCGIHIYDDGRVLIVSQKSDIEL